MKKICALLTAALMLLSACSAAPGTTEAPVQSGTPSQGTETGPAGTETEAPTTEAVPRNEIVIWTIDGEVERTRTLCEYYLGRPQSKLPVPEGGWTVTVKTVPAEELTGRMKEAADTGYTAGSFPEAEQMPDLYFFYSDDFEQLEKAGMLSPVPAETAEELEKKTVPAAFRAAESDDVLMAYPSDLDHTLLLYYNRSIVSEPGNLADVISQCEAAGRCFYVGSETTVFPASVFLSCGLTYTPVLRADGSVKQVNCDYYSEQGLRAARLMETFMSRDGFRAVEGSPVLAFAYQEEAAGAVIADSYQTSEIKSILGEDYAVAVLPAITETDNTETEASESDPAVTEEAGTDETGDESAAADASETADAETDGSDAETAGNSTEAEGGETETAEEGSGPDGTETDSGEEADPDANLTKEDLTEADAESTEAYDTAEAETEAPEDRVISLLSMGTFTMIGVTPKQDDAKQTVCHALAEYLVSAEAQSARYKESGTMPVNEAVLAANLSEDNETASALAAQMPNVQRKAAVSPGYFEAMDRFTEKLLAGGSEMKTAKLQQLLDELSAFLMADVTKEQE